MRRLAIVAALVATIACGVVTAMNQAAAARHAANLDAIRASQTLAEGQLLERHVIDLETALRGFVPTGDRVFLAPWYAGQAAIPGDFAALRNLTRDRRDQAHDLAAIQRAVRTYESGYAAPLLAGAPVGVGQLDGVTHRGKMLLDALRGQMDAFDGVQLGLLRAAERRADAAQKRFSLVGIGSMAGLVLALVGLVLYIRRVVIVPVRRVIAACAELAGGQRSGDLRVEGAPELRGLARAFNAMAAELEQRERALRDRERMLAESQAIAHVGSWALDLGEGRLTWSDELCRIAGQPLGTRPTVDEFLAMVHPEDRHLLGGQIAQAKAGSKSESEYRIVRPDGGIRHVHTARFARVNELGEVIGLFGTTNDITERMARERQLRQFASIVEHSAEAITGNDAGGTITEWNAGAERLYGYSASEAIGRPMSLIVPAEGQGEAMWLLERALGDETIEQFQTERRRKDGSRFEASITVSPVRDHQGKPVGASVITRDVSARRQAEREREKALAQLGEAQRMASLGSWTWDVGTDEASWSDEMYRIFARSPQAGPAIGEEFFAYLHPDDREQIVDGYPRSEDGAPAFELDYRIIRGDGDERVLHATGRMDRPGQYVGTVQDITDLRALEREARESERRFRSTFENAPIGMTLVAPDGRFLQVNHALAEILGYSEPELLGVTFQDLTHPDDLEADLGHVRQLLAGEITHYRMEKRYFHKSGHVVWVELSVSLLRDAGGEPVHFISQIRDITAERGAREALEASERRYQSIAANVPGAVYRFAMSPEGEFSLPFISAGARDIYEVEPGQLMADASLILDAVHPEEQARFRESVARSAAGLTRWEWHGRHVMPGGEVKYLHGVSQPFRDGDGTVVWDGVIFDETEIRLAHAKEAETTQRLRTILENLTGSAVTLYDREQRLRFCEGPLFAHVDIEALLGRPLAEFVGRDTVALLAPGIDGAFAGRVSTAVLEGYRGRQTLAIHFTPYRVADGTIEGALVHWHDITAVRSAERARDEAEGRFQIVFERAPIGMVIVGLDGRFERVNDALCEMTGHGADELLAMAPFAIVDAEDVERVRREFMRLGETDTLTVEHRLAHPSGEVKWVQARVTMIRDDAGQPVHALAQVLDISERRSYEQRLRHLADHDPLTGLMNRRGFEAALDGHLARCRRYGATGALLVLDLDGFKAVNDARGHAAGDEVLVGCAHALRGRLRDTDVISRLGGDEFAILLPAEGPEEARAVAQALIDTVRAHAALLDASGAAAVTASIGIAPFRDDGLSAREMLIKTDLAMYAAKDAGKDRYAVSVGEGHVVSEASTRAASPRPG